MTYKSNASYIYFIGIDVSRNKLDVAVLSKSSLLSHDIIDNNPDAITQFVNCLSKLPDFTFSCSVFCMEATGIYCNHITTVLTKFGAHLVRENPLHMSLSLGLVRGKDDKNDAIKIAKYAYRNRDELKLQTIRRPIIEELAYLIALRRRLNETIQKLRTPMDEQDEFVARSIATSVKQNCVFTIKAAELDLEALNKKLVATIRSDEKLSRLFDIITSVPNVGWVTAMYIIVFTNEMNKFNTVKRFACYSGIAPFRYESGISKKRMRISRTANKEMKSLIHMCAVGAIRLNPTIRTYYLRKLEDGKPKLTVINAVRNKLVAIIFACIHEDRMYVKFDELKQQQVELNTQHVSKVSSDIVEKTSLKIEVLSSC